MVYVASSRRRTSSPFLYRHAVTYKRERAMCLEDNVSRCLLCKDVQASGSGDQLGVEQNLEWLYLKIACGLRQAYELILNRSPMKNLI